VPRNVPDDVLDLVKANDGVVMVTFVAAFASPKSRASTSRRSRSSTAAQGPQRPATSRRCARDFRRQSCSRPSTIAQVADHIDYIAKRIGTRHVGIGERLRRPTTPGPSALSDVSMYPNLFAELIRRGWKDPDLEALAGRNVLRCCARVSRRRRLQAERR
jgi:membrane dipeptidase